MAMQRYRAATKPFKVRRLKPSSGILHHHFREYRGAVLRHFRDLDRDTARDLFIRLRDVAVGIGYDRRFAGIGLFANADIQRQAAEKFGVVIGAHLLAAARSENMLFMPAFRTDMRAHVFHNTDDLNADLLEHLEPLARIHQRDVLRGGYDHRAGERHLLGQRKLDVAGAGRQVNDQIVQVIPARLAQQLIQRLRDHRAAPDHRRIIAGDEEADGHRLQTIVAHWRHEMFAVRTRLTGNAQHGRLRGPVDIGIQHADTRAFGSQGQCDIYRRGGLAHTALAARYCDDVPHAVHQLRAMLHRVLHHFAGYVDADAAAARQRRLEMRFDHGANLVPHALCRVAEHDVQRHVVAVDLDVLQDFTAGEIFPGIRVDQILQCALHVGFAKTHYSLLKSYKNKGWILNWLANPLGHFNSMAGLTGLKN